MFCGERGDVGVGFVLGLLDESHAAALIEPGGDAAGECAVALCRDDGDLAAAGLGVVLLHGGLARGEFLLDLSAIVATDAGELFVGIVEFVVVELELGLGDVEIVGVGDGAVGLLEGGGEGVDVGLVIFDDVLELLGLLLDGESVAGEGTLLKGGLAKSEGEGLIYFVVGESLGFACEGLLFGRDGEWGEGLDGLPWALIDERVRGRRAAFASEEGHMTHGTAGQQDAGEAENEEGCGYYDGQVAKNLHGSTLHGRGRGFKG